MAKRAPDGANKVEKRGLQCANAINGSGKRTSTMLNESKALSFGLISCEREYKAFTSTNNAFVIANKRLQTCSTKGRV